MGDDVFTKAPRPDPRILGEGYSAPPSTLAAQLVENISVSTKSSISDEGSELRGFFTTIQRVKDNPQLLTTTHDRIEHNHVLIYVYCRVVLDGFKFDDPFLDPTHVRTEILKATNFLRFTVKETPIVLDYKVPHGRFLFRGQEPLWLWLLPRLLRLLGHPKCVESEDCIKSLIQYILLVVAQTGQLWSCAPAVMLYLRMCFTGLLGFLQDTLLIPTQKDRHIELDLPPKKVTDRILDTASSPPTRRLFYHIDRVSQALRQITSFGDFLMYPLVSGETAFESIPSFTDHLAWLLDSLVEVRAAQRRWASLVLDSPMRTIDTVLRVLAGSSNREHFFPSLRDKATALLMVLCTEVVSTPDGQVPVQLSQVEDQRIFCLALFSIGQNSAKDSAVARLALSRLVNELRIHTPAIPEQSDLWRTIQTLQQVASTYPAEPLDQRTHPSQFQDHDLQRAAEAMGLKYTSLNDDEVAPAKRRKVSNDQVDTEQYLISRLENALGFESAKYTDDAYIVSLREADESEQCLILDTISRGFCLMDFFKMPASVLNDFHCDRCDERNGVPHYIDNKPMRPEFSAFMRIIESISGSKSRRPRVIAMMALRRMVMHCHNRELLDLETSTLGQWCLQSLNSSLRELRIASGRTLAAFMLERQPQPNGSRLHQEVTSRNRKNALAFLRSMSEKNEARFVETCIMAWGQLGRAVTEDELNLVLIKLLEYLGSSNNLVSSFAFNELLNLAEARDVTPRRLLEPFWPNLAYMATKDMVHRPQMSRAIADLLQVSVNELLVLIQTHALPWLVLHKQRDVIQKIAEARHDTEMWKPLLESSNMAAVIAMLVVQDTEDIEAFTMARLREASPSARDWEFIHLLQSEPVLIAMELLKAAGEAEDSRKPLIRRALQLMATKILATNKDTKQKKGNLVGRFLHSHLLGLMARLTDIINDSSSTNPPPQEQRRCIRAMEEMIKVCKDYARIARPQISACLLSALAHDALREASLSCWTAMLIHLEEEDVEALLETTFFIVIRYWALFDEPTMMVAKKMLLFLTDSYEPVVARYISKLPSFSGILTSERNAEALAEIESRLAKLRPNLGLEEALNVFSDRICHENSGVVLQALIELVPYLEENQAAVHASAVSQQPDTVISSLMRAILDCAWKYSDIQADISELCTRALGLVGCLDPNKVETVREERSIVVLRNFEDSEEMVDFGLFLIEVVLVPSFLSATDVKLQGFLSFAMQELLERCEVRKACAMQSVGMLGIDTIYRKWIAIPEAVREVVTPFLASRYVVAPMAPTTTTYPIFSPGKQYGWWLRSFVVDLLQKGQTPWADLIFEPLMRVIRVKDLSAAEFLLPYVVLHIILGSRSTQEEKDAVLGELVGILQHRPSEDASYLEKEDMKRFCHAVFRVVDYAMRWIQAKKSSGHLGETDRRNVSRVQQVLDAIPAELLSQRAIDCNEYARALFHLEQHAQNMQQRKREPEERTRLLERLQDIYANIDEPDGLDGISTHLPVLDINQQILSHRKAGRWTAVQSWYEMQLAEKPDNLDVQVDLLHCLKQAGQHDVLLNHIEGMHTDVTSDNKIMPFAVEAAWVTGRWESLSKFTKRFHGDAIHDFNVSLATIFENYYQGGNLQFFKETIRDMRRKVSSSMNTSATASLQACHDLLLQCHVLTDLEIIIGNENPSEKSTKNTMELLNGRLEVVGAYFNDKQYILGIRRAAMGLCRKGFSNFDISGLWLSSARLARKTGSLHQSFTAVLHASQLGDDAATIENAKLLWIDGHHRKAIQMLQGAIQKNKFMTQTGSSATASSSKLNSHQRLLTARAQLLLAKWLDGAGQTHAGALREKYQQPPKTYSSWEKGHYYLGRHYKKILEAEKPLKVDDQSDNYVTGEIARLVIENYVRSLNSGTKYLYQTLPRILTLWLDLGAQVDKAPEGKVSLSRELYRRRVEQLNLLHTFLDKYIQRLPAYIFYTALPQIVARIAHPNPNVFERLTHIIVKVVEAHPRQALWSLIGIMTSKQVSERKARGAQILQTLRTTSRKVENTSYDLKHLLRMGERLAEQLLLACQNGSFETNKNIHASLTRDLRFNHKCAPCPLVVPVESFLTATLPAVSEYVKKHKAFSRDAVTIDCFLDDVLVLSSLAKPRRLTARGTDGKSYMLLIKPKDDLRTDQRLMEFNGIINRSLKRDVESSRRQLYVRTYAVTPLNEECGIIEWVPGIKTMRDILINLYAARKIYPDYRALQQLMNDASAREGNLRIFTDEVLGRFPPVLHLWFIQQFPNPSSWFAARLRYTRSCAVMSMVGTILGLGDRHGENVNLEEGNGGVFHVDFNCLFDKGLTFTKPERVPFRLTHNMVAAMGIYGYEGPFRRSSELTLSILRQQEETLMTILEAFIYDPTLDLQKEKRSSRRGDVGIKLQPQSVVDSIKRKVKGLLPNESIPLGVEGQVEELIKQAVDPRNLAAMYIGWCPFL